MRHLEGDEPSHLAGVQRGGGPAHLELAAEQVRQRAALGARPAPVAYGEADHQPEHHEHEEYGAHVLLVRPESVSPLRNDDEYGTQGKFGDDA